MQVKYLGIFGKHRLLSSQQKFCSQSVSSEHLVEQNNSKMSTGQNCYAHELLS